MADKCKGCKHYRRVWDSDLECWEQIFQDECFKCKDNSNYEE